MQQATGRKDKIDKSGKWLIQDSNRGKICASLQGQRENNLEPNDSEIDYQILEYKILYK